jgi:Family of unknown function (DUF6325)
MSHAPLELLMVGFPGSQFNGDILPALAELVDSGTIRIVDLVLVAKGDDGLPIIIEVESDAHDLAGLRDIVGDVNGLISEEDIVDLAAGMDPGDSAAIMLFEHTWAGTFADAVRAAKGEVVVSLRIPQEALEEVLAAQAGEG